MPRPRGDRSNLRRRTNWTPVLTGPDGIERAWSFVQGTMVVDALVPSDHSPLTERSSQLCTFDEILSRLWGAMSIRYHEDSTYPPDPQVHICGSNRETGLRLGVGTTACLTTLEEMGDLRSGRMGTSSQVELQRVDRQIIRGVVEYGCGQRAIAALAKAIGYDEGRTACRTMTLIQLGCLKAVGKTLGRLEELHNRLKGFDFFQRLGIPRDADPEHISRARATV